jgi:hypothetical protein
MLPSRNKDAWRVCLEPVFDALISITSLPDQDPGCGDVTSTSLPIGQDSDVTHTGTMPMFHTRIIQTEFEHNNPVNRRFPAPYNRLENVTWTREERLKAECGPVVQDVEELETLVSIFPLYFLFFLSSNRPSCLPSTPAMVVKRKVLISRYQLMRWRGAFL